MGTSDQTGNPHPHAANSGAAASAPETRCRPERPGAEDHGTASPGLLEDLRSPRRPTKRGPAPPRPRPLLTARGRSTRMRATVRVRRRGRPPASGPGRFFDAPRALRARLLAPLPQSALFSFLRVCLLPSSLAPGVLRAVFPLLEPEGLRRTGKR